MPSPSVLGVATLFPDTPFLSLAVNTVLISVMAGVQKTAGAATLKTCQNCYKAKIRCDRGDEGAACVRCSRLNKTCVYSAARRRRNNDDRDSRIESLEATLRKLAGGGDGSTATATAANTSAAERRQSHPNSNATMSGSRDHDAIPRLTSQERAGILLLRYQTSMIPHFPFVVPPSAISLDAMQQGRPLLLLAILAAAAYDDIRCQRKLGDEFKRAILERMFDAKALTLDTLQALLVHLAWSQYHSRPRRYTQYLELAISIVIDLRLDRSPDTRPWKRRIDMRIDAADDKNALTLDEQRAVAGCYYLSCSISKLLQKHCSFPWSVHVEECCKLIAEHGNCQTDRYVYPMVQLQHVIEQADSGAFPASAPIIEPVHQNVNVPLTAGSTALAHLRSELDHVRSGLPFSMLESRSLKMQYHTAEIYLCLVGISTNPRLNDLPSEDAWPSLRMEWLSTGIVAAKSMLDFCLQQPPKSEMNYNNTEWIQISFALTLATRLAILTSQESLRSVTAHLRSFLDIDSTLRDLHRRVENLVTEEVDDAGDRSVLFHIQGRLQRLETWHRTQSAASWDEGAGRLAYSGVLNMHHLDSAPPVDSVDPFTNLEPIDSEMWMKDSWLDGIFDFSALHNPHESFEGVT